MLRHPLENNKLERIQLVELQNFRRLEYCSFRYFIRVGTFGDAFIQNFTVIAKVHAEGVRDEDYIGECEYAHALEFRRSCGILIRGLSNEWVC